MIKVPSIYIRAIVAIFVVMLTTDAVALVRRVGLLEAVDSAATAIIEERTRDAARWIYYTAEISDSPHAPTMASCLRASADVYKGHYDEARATINAILNRYATASDTMSINCLALAYCAKGRLEVETSNEPSDSYYMKAERLARSIGNTRLELLSLRNRAQLYVGSQRFVEAAHCARLLLARCADGAMPDMRFWARIILIRVYLAIHVDAVIEDCAHDIEREGYFRTNPALLKAYLVTMSVVRLCQGKTEAALTFIEKADAVADQTFVSDVDKWRLTAIKAETYLRLGRINEAKKLAAYCRNNLDVVSPSQVNPYFSRYSFIVVEADIALFDGKPSEALRLLTETEIPKVMFTKSSFSKRYYSSLERAYVALGDFASARNTLNTANVSNRYILSLNARTRAKDMEVAFREDTTILRQRTDINMRKEVVGSVKRQVFGATVVILVVFIVVAIVWMRNVWGRNARKMKDDEAINRKMEEEMERQTAAYSVRNRLIMARNADMAASQSYAKRLQRGILPDMSHLINLGYKNSYVLRGPADVTSSCFFWYRNVGDYLLLCTANADWDGVPGAMLSMVGLTLVEEVASRYEGRETASEILSDVEHGFTRRLPDKRWRSNLSMSVALIDRASHSIRISSAGVDVMLRRGGNVEVIHGSEHKIGDVKDIRRQEDEVRSFTSGDAVYLYSSTMTKVYGGNDGRQLGVVGLHDMLVRSSRLPADLQYDTMLNEVILWKSGRTMGDDILLLAVSMP